MGRIRTKLVKRTGRKLITNNSDLFNSDFNNNKSKIIEVADINSKKLRNIIAGYITKLQKTKK